MPRKKRRVDKWPKLKLRPLFEAPDLWELAARIHPSLHAPKKMEPLSAVDRRIIANILFRILGQEDPRMDFYELVSHRPEDPILFTAKYEAVYEIVLDERFGVPLSAAKLAAMKRWSLTKDQLKHALKAHQKDIKSLIWGMEESAAIEDWEYSKNKDPKKVLEDVLGDEWNGCSIKKMVEAKQRDMQINPHGPPLLRNKKEAEARRDSLLSLEGGK